MSYDYEIKEGDSIPDVQAQIRTPGHKIADLSSVQGVDFRMYHVDSDTLVADGAATIDDANAGLASYDLSSSETAATGIHLAEWRVTKSDGDVYSYPNDENQVIYIHEGAGRGLGAAETAAGSYTVSTLTAQSVDTDELSNVADHIVGTTTQLESAFNNLSEGDTVWIGKSDTPYRNSQFLDIDVDGVTIQFQSQFAGNGEPIVKVADGANVGGIRIGQNSHVKNIRVIGGGFDGNPTNQSGTAPKHNIEIHDAESVVIENNHCQRAHPHHVHGGGSGITVLDGCSEVWVINNRVDDTGDRCIQNAGSQNLILGNRLTNGFDRGIGLDSYEGFDGTGNGNGSRTIVANNMIRDLVQGSCIATAGTETTDIPEWNLVIGNRMFGQFRGMVQFDHDNGRNNAAIGNMGFHDGADLSQPALIAKDNDLLANNYLWDESATSWDYPILIRGANNHVVGNYIRANNSSETIRLKEERTNDPVTGNYVGQNHLIANTHGIVQLEGGENMIVDNTINGWLNNAIWVSVGDGTVVAGNYGQTSNSQNALVRNDVTTTTVKDNVLMGSGSAWDMTATPAVVDGNSPRVSLSSPPSNPSAGDQYLDDGTNTGSGTEGVRVYLGGAWSDWVTA